MQSHCLEIAQSTDIRNYNDDVTASITCSNGRSKIGSAISANRRVDIFVGGPSRWHTVRVRELGVRGERILRDLFSANGRKPSNICDSINVA